MTDFARYEQLVPDVILFVDRRCFPDWGIARAPIDFHDLTFVVGGQADYYLDGVRYTVEAGDLLYAPPGTVREANTNAESPMHSYAFNFFWQQPHNDVRLPFPAVSKQRLAGQTLELVKTFHHVWMSKQPGYAMQARGLFMLIIHRLLAASLRRESDPIADPRIERMKSFLVEHYADDIGIDVLAETIGLHPVYLGRLFKQQTGVTYRTFLNTVRINNAEAMLTAGGFTVGEVAERCGFKDISYFSNVFKAMKGYPPSAAVSGSSRL